MYWLLNFTSSDFFLLLLLFSCWQFMLKICLIDKITPYTNYRLKYLLNITIQGIKMFSIHKKKSNQNLSITYQACGLFHLPFHRNIYLYYSCKLEFITVIAVQEKRRIFNDVAWSGYGQSMSSVILSDRNISMWS